MVVIFVALISLIGMIWSLIRREMENDHVRQRAQEKGEDWWYDYHLGCRVRMSDGKKYNLKTVNKDLCEVDLHGNILRNISLEERKEVEKESKKMAIKNGSDYYMINPIQHSSRYRDGYYGEHWRRMSNHGVYVKRRCGDTVGWLNVETGMIDDLMDNGSEKSMLIAKKEMEEHNKDVENKYTPTIASDKRIWRYVTDGEEKMLLNRGRGRDE